MPFWAMRWDWVSILAAESEASFGEHDQVTVILCYLFSISIILFSLLFSTFLNQAKRFKR